MTLQNRHKQLVVMVKRPIAGQVKTRLARDVGVAQATSFYRHATRNVVSRLARDARWQTVLAVTPDTAIASNVFASKGPRCAQGTGDLGQRMDRIMGSLPPGPVVIIGSDSPAISGTHINAAFEKLGAHDAVIGPALDGGYWLIGLKRFPRCPHIFNNVRWSSAHTLVDTMRNIADLRVAMLEPLSDVDTGADLRASCALHGRRILPID